MLEEAREAAQRLIESTEQTRNYVGDRLPWRYERAAWAAIGELRTAMAGISVEDIKAKTHSLALASMKLGEAYYGSVPLLDRCEVRIRHVARTLTRLVRSIPAAIQHMLYVGTQLVLGLRAAAADVFTKGWYLFAGAVAAYLLFLYGNHLGLKAYVDLQRWGAFIYGSLYLVAVFKTFTSQAQWGELEDAIGGGRRLGHKRRRKLVRRETDRIAAALNSVVLYMLSTTLLFFLSTHLWYSVQPNIFLGDDHGPFHVLLFVLDLFLRGSLLDVMEHFKLSVTDLKMNSHELLFVFYAFSYRLYVPLFIIATVFRYIRLTHEMRSLEVDA